MSAKPLPFDPIEEARRHWAERFGAPAADAMATATSIMRAQQLVLSAVDGALKPFELTFARYEGLMLLYFSRRGALPLGKMGPRLMIHPTSVTNIIDRLEQQGLVRRVAHPTDGRTTLAELTERGRRRAEEATKAVNATLFGLADLGPSDLRKVVDIVTALRRESGDFDAS